MGISSAIKLLLGRRMGLRSLVWPGRRDVLRVGVGTALAALLARSARAETSPAETPRKKAYSIVDVQIRDKEVFYKQYVPGHGASLEKFGGRFLVATPRQKIIEGNWPADHVVVVHEWPDSEHFEAWYNSSEYEPWKKLRHSVSSANVILVEGV